VITAPAASRIRPVTTAELCSVERRRRVGGGASEVNSHGSAGDSDAGDVGGTITFTVATAGVVFVVGARRARTLSKKWRCWRRPA